MKDFGEKIVEAQDAEPIVSQEDLDELQAAIEQFNEEQASGLITPEKAHEMLEVYSGHVLNEDKQVISRKLGWEGALSKRQREILAGCRSYTGCGAPGHNIILLIRKMDQILSEGE